MVKGTKVSVRQPALAIDDEVAGLPRVAADGDGARLSIWQSFCRDHGAQFAAAVGGDWWAAEPAVCRVVDGLPREPKRGKGKSPEGDRPSRSDSLGPQMQAHHKQNGSKNEFQDSQLFYMAHLLFQQNW